MTFAEWLYLSLHPLYSFPILMAWLHSIYPGNVVLNRLHYTMYIRGNGLYILHEASSDEFLEYSRNHQCNSSEVTCAIDTPIPLGTYFANNRKYMYHGPYVRDEYTLYYLDIYFVKP